MKDMTVLHCIGSYLPNTENWLYRLIKNQDATRYVAAHEFLPGNFYLDDVTYLRPQGMIKRQGFVERNLNRLLGRGISDHGADILRRLGPNKPDVMHSHFAHIGWQYQTLASRLQIPHVVSFYGMDYERVPHQDTVWHARYREMFQSAQRFMCEGTHGARILEKLGCPPEKIAVSRLGVDIAEIPVHIRTKKIGELKLVQVASFREKKGHIDTIKAFAKAFVHCPGISLTLVGSGDEDRTRELTDEIERLGISGQINLISEIDFSRLHDFLKDYHVFIHPSCHTADKDCEGGAPVVLLDAQATGMPVISTFHCDIPDEVLDRRTGILSPEHDVDSLAASIIEFVNMPEGVYSVYASNAVRHVSENYDSKTNVTHLLELYRDTLKKNR